MKISTMQSLPSNGNHPLLSVALCTYNGSNYIERQLQSILFQTHPVDEIVVCDDGSTDSTLQIIEDLAGTTDIAIHIHRNETNLGPARNFQKALDLCSGDIILLSDQDDLWLPDKVKHIATYFASHPDKQVLFSDATLIDSDDNPLPPYSLWDTIRFSPDAQKAFAMGYGIELFACANRATGATMALRQVFIQHHNFEDLLCNEILHDGALAMLALGENQLGFIPDRLTSYRIHASQTIGIGNPDNKPSSDHRATSFLNVIWSQQSTPSWLKARLSFSAKRYRITHQALGIVRILKSIRTYCHQYHSQWLSFIMYDLYQWGKTNIHK